MGYKGYTSEQAKKIPRERRRQNQAAEIEIDNGNSNGNSDSKSNGAALTKTTTGVVKAPATTDATTAPPAKKLAVAFLLEDKKPATEKYRHPLIRNQITNLSKNFLESVEETIQVYERRCPPHFGERNAGICAKQE